ncbi:hypothetical protein MTO96_030680 [Rhipicephalus appendiculatus]
MDASEKKKSNSNRMCSVPQCSNRAVAGEVSLHVFPRDKKLRKLWEAKMRIGKKVTGEMYACSEHFRQDDYFWSHLGASPDGLVWDRGISDYSLLEVKTLAKAMEEGLSVEEAIKQKRALFLKTGKLSHRHKYFYQIQGQLGITGMQWCDLIVESGRDLYIERIEFDAHVWEDMLAIMSRFYQKYDEADE